MKIINGKYVPFLGMGKIDMSNRVWPNVKITEAPIWCSVDLRDGNQALQNPMTVKQKIEMFRLLVEIGFKEIEVGFPASSPTEYGFIRRLIEENMIPDDVIIQVLVQAREDLIKETINSLEGVKKVIIHLYNSTSPAQRRVVFRMEKPEIINLAVQGTRWVKEYGRKLQESGADVCFQYSPESFSATEIEFSLEICEAVQKEWGPTPDRKMIFNLPSTVEVFTPNVYADMIEWFCENISKPECSIVSVHTHNDRGTGVASTELGMMAGASRVEGTLFGNGERTGNADIITVALNLFSQGVDSKLQLDNIDYIREIYERCTGMSVHPRHPYSGELVFTAFSGSHQDAIRKGLAERDKRASNVSHWDVPYLLIDPHDIGREYKEVIRVNGQSGRAGVTHLLERDCGLRLPRDLEREFGQIAGKKIDGLGREVGSTELKDMFWSEYGEKNETYKLKSFFDVESDSACTCKVEIVIQDNVYELDGAGNGPIDAFVNALHIFGIDIHVIDQSEHSLSASENAYAIAYILLKFSDDQNRWGVGVSTSIKHANINAIISALNRK